MILILVEVFNLWSDSINLISMTLIRMQLAGTCSSTMILLFATCASVVGKGGMDQRIPTVVPILGFAKIRRTSLGVLMLRITIFGGLHWGSLI